LIPAKFWGLLRAGGGGVKAEDAEEGGGGADFGEGSVERSARTGFDVEIELVFKRPPVDGAAFDFLQIDAVTGEGFEGGEESSGSVGEAQCDRHFIGFGRSKLRGLRRQNEQYEASEIFGIVMNVFGEDGAAVDGSGAARGDSGKRFVAASDYFFYAAGGVFRWSAL